MLIDSHQASRFISAYKAVLLELHHLSGVIADSDDDFDPMQSQTTECVFPKTHSHIFVLGECS